MRKILLIIGASLVLIGMVASCDSVAQAADEPISAGTGDFVWIEVDGTVYQYTKASGSAVHYETPDTNPTSAFTAFHVWTGNGSENLPCLGGIHWIDNKNLLTVSHCLPTTTTTTSLPPTVTTTTAPTTTTTVPTTVTTTTVVTSTTTIPEVVTDLPELPNTGVPARVFGYIGVAFLILGIATVSALKK